jgi:type IX secretion system PorP/SprF family membrane protein
MKRVFNFLIWLLLPISLSGQLTPVTNQYVLNPMTINPAYAGSRGALNFAAFYRRQWIGIPGSPETMTLLIDAPLFDEKVGLGLNIISDKIGVTKETQFLTSYSYKMNIGQGKLSLGLGAGVITTNTAWSDLVVLDPGDEFYMIDSRLFVVPSFSFGTYYSWQGFFAGVSIPKFLSYKFDFNKNKYTLEINPEEYSYTLTTGNIFVISPKFNLFPSTMISYTPGNALLWDLNLHVNFLKRFWAGGSYRNGRSFATLFQIQLNDQFRMAYTYDIDFGELNTYSNGSHEIMLRYEFKYKVNVMNPLSF